MVSKAREDLPEPESPVMTTSLSRGISTSMFLRLCSRAPLTTILFMGLGSCAECAKPEPHTVSDSVVDQPSITWSVPLGVTFASPRHPHTPSDLDLLWLQRIHPSGPRS